MAIAAAYSSVCESESEILFCNFLYFFDKITSGLPSSAFLTIMSLCQISFLPSAFQTASFAANLTAKCCHLFFLELQYETSVEVYTFSRNFLFVWIILFILLTSIISIPVCIILFAIYR